MDSEAGKCACSNFPAPTTQKSRKKRLIDIALVRIMTQQAKARLFKHALLVGALLIQFGCAKKEVVTPKALIADLQKYFDAHPNCVALAISFPAEVQDLSNDPYSELLPALEAGGVIRRVPTHTVNRFIPSIRFEVTEIGSKYLRNKPDKNLGGSELCYSHRHVLSIISVERISGSEREPELLRVSYRFEQQGNGPWSVLPGVQNITLSNVLTTRANKRTASNVLVHTESGWEPKG